MSLDNIEDLCGLSPMQKGMLFHTLYAPRSGVYFNQTAWQMTGNLDIAAFVKAWQRVIARHTILRTAFFWEDLADPLQVVLRSVALPLIYSDLRALSQAQQQQQIDKLLDDDRRRGFDIATAPLMRLLLLRLADDTHQLVWSRHHILLDGWSQALVLKEVFTMYELLRLGAVSPAEELAVLGAAYPFSTYIAWLQRQDSVRTELFWRKALEDFSTPTRLRVAEPAGAAGAASHECAEETIRLSPETTAGLQALVQQHKLTLSTLVQGIWAVLISYFSGMRDVVYGVTVSGRPSDLPGIETLAGLFINTLPARARLDEAALLLPWLKDLQQQHAELRQYEHSALVDVQGWSAIPRHIPLFETIVVIGNYPTETEALEQYASLRLQLVRSSIKNNLPLTLRIVPAPALPVCLLYEQSRFNRGTILHMLNCFERVCCSMLQNQDVSIHALMDVLHELDQKRLDEEQTHFQATSSSLLKNITRRKVSGI
jgi:hypothetical protein